MSTIDLDVYYTWQLERLRRREAILGCLLPELIEEARLPGVRRVLKTALRRTEEQLQRLIALIGRDPRHGGDDAEASEIDVRSGLEAAPASGSSRIGEISSLVTAHEIAVLTACGYAWTQLLAERLERPHEGRILRRTLQEKAEVNLDLMTLASELLSRGGWRPRGVRRIELAG